MPESLKSASFESLSLRVSDSVSTDSVHVERCDDATRRLRTWIGITEPSVRGALADVGFHHHRDRSRRTAAAATALAATPDPVILPGGAIAAAARGVARFFQQEELPPLPTQVARWFSAKTHGPTMLVAGNHFHRHPRVIAGLLPRQAARSDRRQNPGASCWRAQPASSCSRSASGASWRCLEAVD
eukprot:COSAG04_NODE_13160_length_617_cov_1.795367_1_plen_185_part_10